MILTYNVKLLLFFFLVKYSLTFVNSSGGFHFCYHDKGHARNRYYFHGYKPEGHVCGYALLGGIFEIKE